MKVLITGASSGIGQAYAFKFASRGYDLILTGRREELLYKVSSAIRKKYRVNIEVIISELADSRELEKLVNHIGQIPDIYAIVNNAGFGSGRRFSDDDTGTIENMVKVHVLAPLKIIHAVLPQMRKRNHGIIINVSSISGKTPLPSGSVYSATKSFLKMFSEALYLENINSGIMVQALCPGFTRTDFHSKIGLNSEVLKNKGLLKWMTPEEVVEISFKNLKKGRVICVPGFWNKVLWTLAGILPRNLYYKIVTRTGKEEQLTKPKQLAPEYRNSDSFHNAG